MASYIWLLKIRHKHHCNFIDAVIICILYQDKATEIKCSVKFFLIKDVAGVEFLAREGQLINIIAKNVVCMGCRLAM